jgi:pyruvate,water dikinase
VILPGAMATASYVLVGTDTAKETFYSTCFAPYTKVLTNKGLIKIENIYNKIKKGEELLALSINEKTLKAEWKKITNTMKREGELLRVSVSQQGRKKENTLDLTDDHKMITFSGLNLCDKKIRDIIENDEMVCVLDRIPPLENLENHDNEAYLAGAIFSDGYLRPYQVTFKQKENDEKTEFINSVRSSFEDVFNFPLINVGTSRGGGVIDGRQINGEGTEFRCSRRVPAEKLIKLRENISEWILRNNNETAASYLAGIVDGDGTFNTSNDSIQIFSGKEKIIDSIILSCLRLGIVPYLSKNRSCLNIHITENKNLIFEKTKRVTGKDEKRKYGTKLFSTRQLFDRMNLNWPFKQKSIRNNFMSKEIISRYLNRCKEDDKEILQAILDSDIRMQRVRKVADLGQEEVYNITVEDNHNYVVFTSHLTPVIVKNCHGAGRVSSRSAMLREVRGEEVARRMANQGILTKAASWKVLAEEASEAYKNIDEVAKVTQEAGISRIVARLVPIAVMKG